MRAVILAGGQGTRLRPLTDRRPKALVPLFDQPLLMHTVDHLVRNGVDDLVLALGQGAEDIIHALARMSTKVRIRYCQESQPLGTAGAVRYTLGIYPTPEPFLVVPGDVVTTMDLGQFVKASQQQGAEVALALAPVDDVRGFGMVERDQMGWITAFSEKPPHGPKDGLVNTGIYYLTPQHIARLPGGPIDFGYDVFPAWLAQGLALWSWEGSGYWTDLGTPERYRQAILYDLWPRTSLLGGDETAGQSPHWPGVRVFPPVSAGLNVQVEPGAVIGPYVVLGENVRVATRSRVAHSVIGQGVMLGEDTRVVGAVIDSEVVVGKRAEIGLGAVIGSGARIGRSRVVANGAHVGAGEHQLQHNIFL